MYFFRRKTYPLPVSDKRPALTPINLRVSMIVHDPIIAAAGRAPLHQVMNWNDPDLLVAQYCHDLIACSGGIANYTVVESVVVDGYPIKADGFRYNAASYLACWRQQRAFHQPDAVDYGALLAAFDIVGKIERNEIDEVWLFGFPYSGYYESHMVGAGAFWCNSPPATYGADCKRRFVVMGFNYERGVECMLENFGHRVESIMHYVYHAHGGERNHWQRFTRYDRANPGRAECGNVHFAPSSDADYDWGNRRLVLSHADSWYAYPDLSAPPRPMSCDEWGDGDMRAHHIWWLNHLPRAQGSLDGVSNNWWQYVLDPNWVQA